MAKTRRTFTDELKTNVLAYAAKHGVQGANGAAMHFNIVPSVIRRWRNAGTPPKQRAKGEWAKKKWTADKIAAVVNYLKTHTHAETKERFKVSSSQISVWRRGLPYSHYKQKRKANGALPVTNGLGAIPYEDALRWVGRWRQAYFDQLNAETPSAQSVLEALRGEK